MKIDDSLQNVIANLGTPRDKAAHTTYAHTCDDPVELVNAYRTSWLAAAAVDYPVEDSLRKWRNWRAEADQITAIEAEEKRLGLKAKIQEALISSRLLGGSAIYINTNDKDQSAPLSASAHIESLIVLSKDQITPGEVVRDIYSQYYGRPEFYTLTSGSGGAQVSVHASRFAIFYGQKVPGQLSGVSDAWGDPVLARSIAAIKIADSIVANVNSLSYEANVDVMKVQGFAEMLSQNKDDLILRRAHLQAAMKGINGMLMMDAQDSYERNAVGFGGLSDLMLRAYDFAAGATGIPVTRLFGRSVSGLSGDGGGDERVYYDRCGDIQSDDISPAIALLDECIINSALGGRPPEIYYEWAPLRQKTEAESAEIFGKYATGARALLGTNGGPAVPVDAFSDALVNALTENGSLPGLEGYVKQYGSLSEQDNLVGGEEDEI